MGKTVISVNDFAKIESTLYEEDSYGFLYEIIHWTDWQIYDSDIIGLNEVKELANKFMAFHGHTIFPQQNDFLKTFWTAVPIGVFRYKMLSNGLPYLIDSYKNLPGYIVEGVYWINGFVYIVRDNDNIIQIKLFITKETKEMQLYPNVSL